MRFQIGNVPTEQETPPETRGWQRIHSPGSRLGYLLAGLAGFLFPNVLFVWLVITSLPALMSEAAPYDTATPWGAVILALLSHIPLHEAFHAVWHPGRGLSPQTVVIVWPAKLRFGVYYEGCMTRRRWLVMRLAPLVFLSIVPTGILTIAQYAPVPFAIQVFLQVMILVNGIGSGADVVATIWVLRQVPGTAQICFVGGRAYWRAESAT